MHAFAVMEDDTVLRQIDVPVQEPEGRGVRLRVLHSGVCHTDTHLQQGHYDLGRRGQLRLADRGIPYPLVLGHEIVACVESVGHEVRDLEVGDVRLVYPWIGCGQCHRCAAGQENYCTSGRSLGVNRHGGYAEFVSVPDEKYLIDIGGLDPSWAATLACSGLTAFSAANKVLPLPPDAPVAVIGAGGVGLTVVGILAALGHRNICAVDTNPANLAIATETGARTTLCSDGENSAADLMSMCGGPVDAVIDVVNNTQTAEIAFDVLAKGGRLVQIGLFGGEMVVPTVLMPLKLLTVQGSYVGTLDELKKLVQIAKENTLPRPPILPGNLTLEGVSGALASLAAGGVPGRIVLSSPPGNQ
ncbi:alcohol dehydrogenase [Rhodococcus sp. MSC1_016]|jgi:propanol-preferring alcohol dehydrogenase|uniref:alcohol dehydrogenase n=1 Tax=Rhodococcus sp. MSC1_016 TaxID=2909266 RepID=UPI002030514C|nr:alcohol dehydrogenase [Rhodococcus sp. MSC1_016]